MKKALGISAFLLLWTTLLFGQAKFTATATKTNVAVNEPFEVDFVVNANGDRFTPPDFSGFQVMSGPNISTEETMVNGVTTFNNTYGYIVAATKEGAFTIGAAAISVGGHTMLTSAIKIHVKGQASPQAQQQAQQMQIPDPFADDNSQKSEPQIDTKNIAKYVFIRAVADKTHAYVGEQIKVSYKLYTNVGIAGGQVDKAPDLNGFWNQDVQAMVGQQKNTWTTENVNGKKYQVTTIKQSVIFPQHAGDLTVDPLSMVLVLQLPVKAMFDSPFGNYQQIKYSAKSTPISIHATALPTEGKPANFTGAVGNFSVYSDVDKTHLKANETLNYTFEVSGKGNLNLINAPIITPPADFDKYDPKTTDHINVDANGVSGTRQYSYLMMPRHQGEYTLSPVSSFSFFNPSTGKYVTIPGKSFNIKVDKGDQAANMTVFNSSDQQDVKTLGKDIRYIKTTSTDIYKNGEGFFGSAGYFALFLLGPLAFCGAIFYRNWNNKRNSDVVQVKSRKASKVAIRHLAQANAELATGNKGAFYEAIARGLYGYLSDKLTIPVSDLNRENIEEKLKARSIPESTIKNLTETMDLCEMARFAPVSGVSQEEVFEKAKNTINEIEESI